MASFHNSDVQGAQLFYEDQFWDDFSVGKTLAVNTYPGHVWNVKIAGAQAKRWVIVEGQMQQQYFLSKNDLD